MIRKTMKHLFLQYFCKILIIDYKKAAVKCSRWSCIQQLKRTNFRFSGSNNKPANSDDLYIRKEHD